MNQEISQEEQLQDLHMRCLYSPISGSGLPASTLHSTRGAGIPTSSTGTTTTRAVTTLCSLRELSKEENLWNIIMEYKM